MNFKDYFLHSFTYTPKQNYKFHLDSNVNTLTQNNTSTTDNIYDCLNVNLEYMQSRFNTLINSDVVIRKFIVNINNKQHNAFIIYIDGMINSELMDTFVIKPLMIKNQSNCSSNIIDPLTKNISIKKKQKLSLDNYILECLLPQNSVVTSCSFKEISSGINSGNCALFIDSLNKAFNIEVKGFPLRQVEKPTNEIVIKGPHEAFVENIRTNTSLIRKIINNENLIVENVNVGNITNTSCAICYIDSLANKSLVSEVKFRINNLEIDSLLSVGQLEQLITDSNNLQLPQLLSTERPDKASMNLLQGRVIVFVNGSPYALICPSVLSDFLNSPDDKNLKTSFGNFLKSIRVLAMFITLLLPGLYIAITNFHQEIVPTELLFSILASRQNVPLPIIFEILLLEISFELIREAGLRVPSPIGPTIGIVGAVILGQAAVSASIVSPFLIIIVAMTGITSFAIPDFSFGFHLRMYRFLFILLGFTAGFLGISLGIFIYLILLAQTKSFGVSYISNLTLLKDHDDYGFFMPPISKRDFRPQFLNSQKPQKQNSISMKWKF